MPVKWKSKFKPEVVLSRIAASRSRGADGQGASFTGFDLDYCLPSLHSMLSFPEAARDLDHQALLWKAVAQDPGDLTKDSFLKELNRQLAQALSQREQSLRVLTSISLHNACALGKVSIEGVQLEFVGANYLPTFEKHRAALIKARRAPGTESPPAYTKVVASLSAKTPALAFHRALRAVDIHRALWCVFSNAQMEIAGQSWMPINAVRLGCLHTVHAPGGRCAGDGVWFEPHHVLTDARRPRNFTEVHRHVRRILQRLSRSNYAPDIFDALLLYVRALDEWNQTSALVRLWSAVERLASPGHGDYDAVVRRCAFLWNDVSFATQTLEHLREYRNGYMHAGAESPYAKTYCFQLQMHFRNLLFFHIGNSNYFSNLQEANRFLDLPADLAQLARLRTTVSRAERFRKPQQVEV